MPGNERVPEDELMSGFCGSHAYRIEVTRRATPGLRWLAVAVVAAAACGGGPNTPAEQHSDEEINQHVQGLSYDRSALLGVRNITGTEARTASGNPVDTDEAQGTSLLACRATDYSLETNADDVAILRPTNGIVWPGALVKANAALMDGMPEPLTLAPAPVTLRVDLPGIGEHGTFVVDKPSNSAVQTGLDRALAWWNDNAYQEGYVNASNSSYRATTAFSSEQLALDVGLNVRWASGSVASQFNYASTKTGSVAMMVYKQVFYTVTLDTPASPAMMFADSVLPSQCDAHITAGSPPAYVQSVNYGRIIMFRMETSEAVKSADLEATMKYAAGVSVDMTLKTHYEEILKKSSINAITIGGNAEVASQAVTAKTFGDLMPIITGSNAVYSKANPGVPIAYAVRFLKDNSIAKMGYTSSYTSTDCQLWKESHLTVHNGGAYVARAFAKYYPRKQSAPLEIGTGSFTVGADRTLVVPAGATNVELRAQYMDLIFSWEALGSPVRWDIAPENARYCLSGTVFSHSWGACN